MTENRRDRIGRWSTPVVAATVFLLACWQFLGAVDNREMHRDEARWIHRAEYIRELMHPFSDYWDEETWQARGGSMDERFRLRAQPPMGSYVMGIGFLMQGEPLPDIGFWNMDHDDAWNEDHGNAPSTEQVITARRTSAVVGALAVTSIALVANRLTNPVGGLVAGAYLAFHPLMVHLSTFAGSDAVLALAIAASAVAAYRWADRPTWPRAILLGILLGFGASTKLSPLGIAAPLALLGLAAMAFGAWRWRQNTEDPTTGGLLARMSPGLQLLTVPLVAVATLIASYPWLWRDPFTNAKALLDYRTLGMELQGSLWEHIAVPSRTDAFRRIGIRLGEEWTVFEWGWLLAGTEIAVACAGLLLLAWLILRLGLWSAHSLAAAVLAGGTAITIYGLDVDWARYHLPILLLVACCIGIVAGHLGSVVVRRVSLVRLKRKTLAPS